MLGIENYNALDDYTFPPRFLNMTLIGKVEDIKAISVGEVHTLILRHDNTILGIGSNQYGCLTIAETASTEFVKLKIPDSHAQCVDSKLCSVDFIFAGPQTSYIGITDSRTLGKIGIEPNCFGIPHTTINSCSGNGMCVGNDKCTCFKGYYGQKCELKYDCSTLNDCSDNGFCVEHRKCECFSHATGFISFVPSCFVKKKK